MTSLILNNRGSDDTEDEDEDDYWFFYKKISILHGKRRAGAGTGAVSHLYHFYKSHKFKCAPRLPIIVLLLPDSISTHIRMIISVGHISGNVYCAGILVVVIGGTGKPGKLGRSIAARDTKCENGRGRAVTLSCSCVRSQRFLGDKTQIMACAITHPGSYLWHIL